MEKEKLAVIDIGSNSVRLMVAQASPAGELEVLRKDRRMTRLGQGMVETGKISRESIDRTLNGIDELLCIARGEGVNRILAFGTAAVRNASNREEFVQDLHKRFQILVRVLSGEQEAQASFIGAAQGQTAAVVDIGGASTEVMIGVNGTSRVSNSFPMGAVAAMERYPLGAPVDELSQLAMEQWVQTVIRDGNAESIRECRAEFGVDQWLCVGGTAATLASIDLKLKDYSDEAVHGHLLTRQRVLEVRRQLSAMTLEERKRMPGLDPMRADIIVGGITILLGLMDYFGFDRITVSSGDNLEGFARMKLFSE